MSVALLTVAGVALDALLGEPRRRHPLVGFGNFAARLEQRLNAGGQLAQPWRQCLAACRGAVDSAGAGALLVALYRLAGGCAGAVLRPGATQPGRACSAGG